MVESVRAILLILSFFLHLLELNRHAAQVIPKISAKPIAFCGRDKYIQIIDYSISSRAQ
jgi:hypothetical protein